MAPITISEYLFIRLRQLGVESVHGVPGDFNLTLLDYVEPAGLRWVGNANELNAAYAADGYAKLKGIGAVVTTFGVGELSAINAIAGAYAEFAPVVHIVGIPARDLQDAHTLVHHTLNDGDFKRFSQMHAHVTVAQTRLWDAVTCAQQIDDVLVQCLLHSRPVYIEVPVDLVAGVISDERLQSPLRVPEPIPTPALSDALSKIKVKVETAQQPLIIIDGESRPLRIAELVQTLSKTTKWPTYTTPFAKGLLDETEPNFHGVYQGVFGDKATKEFIDSSDLVLYFGPHLSGTNTYLFNTTPLAKETISFMPKGIKIGSELIRDVSSRQLLTQLLEKLDASKLKKYDPYPTLHKYQNLDPKDVPAGEDLAQDRLWRVLGSMIRPGDIVMGETGTPGFGVREMPLAKGCSAFNHNTWLSIGYMLPACQGVSLAQKELIAANKYHDHDKARTILFIGDGSFQMTAQEMSTMIKHELDVIIFLINNDGYSIERFIHGRKQSYNDVAPWRYLEAPSFFGAPEGTYTARAKTYGELKEVLEHEALDKCRGLSMVEVILEREDAPPGQLRRVLDMQIARETKSKAD